MDVPMEKMIKTKLETENIETLETSEVPQHFMECEGLDSSSKEFMCETCNKGFVTLCDLDQHRQKHIGEKPHECEVCSKSFATSSKLKRHFKIHTGQKDHQCDICHTSVIYV